MRQYAANARVACGSAANTRVSVVRSEAPSPADAIWKFIVAFTPRATRVINTGSAAGSVAQTVAIPGSFKYVLSVWAKTTGGSSASLFATTAGGSATKTFTLTSQWKRLSLRIELGQNTESVTFGAELDPGGSVDLFGMQLEAAPGVSDYKKTGAEAGVYAKARFAGDELLATARGTDMFDMVMRIVAS